MASSSAVGSANIEPNLTSGSDAGTLPHLVDAITVNVGSERPVLDDAAVSDLAADTILAAVERALTTGAEPDLQVCVKELSVALVEGLLTTLSDEARENITGVDGGRFTEYVARRVHHACASAVEGVLQPEDMIHLARNLSDMVITQALHAQPLVDRLSTQHLLSEFRRRNLAAFRELKSARVSVFSPGWRDWYLQVPQGLPPPSGRPAVGGTAQGSARAAPSLSQAPGMTAGAGLTSHPSIHSPSTVRVAANIVNAAAPSAVSAASVHEDRRRLAHKDADKAADAFKGGPYTGIDDPRGLSGFWRQLESFVVRRGWRLNGPEHYFLLTNLVPEDEAGDAMDEEAPLTMVAYAQAVERIHQALLEDSGGSLESEKLLSEAIIRQSGESLTSFIAKIDRWARRCKTAGVALSDGHIIKAYRNGINDQSCRDASYEYPSLWREFRVRALTRAARVDSEQKVKSEVSGSGRGEQPRNQCRDKGGQIRPAAPQGGQKPVKAQSICRQHLRGVCNYGDRCKFSHVSGPREECRQWLNGNCRFGDRCVYAHSKKSSDAAASKKPSNLKTVQEGPSDEKEGTGAQSAEEEQLQILWAMPEMSSENGQRHVGPTMLFEVAGEQRPLQALLDSGAVRNYIPQSVVEARGWKCVPADALARLADGSTLRIRGTVRVNAVHGGAEVPLDFHILPPHTSAGAAAVAAFNDRCILGTRSMCALGISLRFSEDGGKRKVIIGRSSLQTQEATGESDPCYHHQQLKPSLPQATATCGTVKVLNEVVTVRFHPDDTLLCHVAEPSDVLVPITSESDGALPLAPERKLPPFDGSCCAVRGAPQYAVRLRPIAADEEKDCPGQTHVAEVRWNLAVSPPGSQTPKPPPDFSIPLYNRLTEQQKCTFRQEIAKFTSRGWWSEVHSVDDEERKDEERLPEAVAFPVPQGQVKVRPCVDVRQCNRQSPARSYVGASCPVILSQVRVALAQIAAKARSQDKPSSLALVTLDCMTAFYRVRLHRKCARIRCLGRVYAARRLVFGLRCGPAVLEEILHRLVGSARDSLSADIVGSLPLYHFIYVDDLTLLGERRAVHAFKEALIRTGASWGFEFAPAKMHSIYFDAEGQCDTFDDFTHLGVLFVAHPLPSGCCELRLRCAHIPLPFDEDLRAGSKLSKRCAFKIAGAAFDALSVHGEQSLAGDIVRRIAGRWQTSSWDESVELSKDEAVALNLALKVPREKPPICEHPVCFHADYLDICSDASPSGMGIVALFARRKEGCGESEPTLGAFQTTVLCRKAKMWKGAQYNWHQNRKEAFALAGAYLFFNSVAAYVSPLTVRFWSDSHTAISWVTGGSKLTCKSLERVAISRLVEAMADLREIWRRRYGLTPVTYHLTGKENSYADDLSRLSALWKVPSTVLQRGGTSVFPELGGSANQGGTPEVVPACDRSPAEQVLTCGSYDGQLFALGAADVLAPPERYAMSAGRPARVELLKLQWRSPCLCAIFSALGRRAPEGFEAAQDIDLPRDLAKELNDFSVAEDGLLMKRLSTTRVHNSRGSRLCYAVPVDFHEGKKYAVDLVSSYHSTSGCLSQRHLRWLVSRTFYISGLRSLVASVCRTCPDCQFGSNRRYYSHSDERDHRLRYSAIRTKS